MAASRNENYNSKCMLNLNFSSDFRKLEGSSSCKDRAVLLCHKCIQTFKELTNPNTLINSSTTLADWTRMSSPTSPYLFKEATQENINIIKNLLKENPYAMFLRKVDRAFPDAALKEIMAVDFGHVYSLLHNQAKSNVNLIKDIIEKKYYLL